MIRIAIVEDDPCSGYPALSRPLWGKKPSHSPGRPLEQSIQSIKEGGDDVTVTVQVSNTGTADGKKWYSSITAPPTPS